MTDEKTPEVLEAERLRKVRVSPEQARSIAGRFIHVRERRAPAHELLVRVASGGEALRPEEALQVINYLQGVERGRQNHEVNATDAKAALKRHRENAKKREEQWKAREAALTAQVVEAEARAKALLGAGVALVSTDNPEAVAAIALLVRIDDALDRGAEPDEWRELELAIGLFLGKKRRRK
jgi:hypothetical protein